MRTAPFAFRFGFSLCVLGGAAACDEPAAQALTGPRVLGVVGDVASERGGVSAGQVPNETATFRLAADAALTLLFANGCVMHVRGPATFEFSTLRALHPDPCPEPIDEQVRLLRGVEGARATLRERTAAAGLDATTVSDAPKNMPDEARQKAEISAEQGAVASAAPEGDEGSVVALKDAPEDKKGAKNPKRVTQLAKEPAKGSTDGTTPNAGDDAPPPPPVNAGKAAGSRLQDSQAPPPAGAPAAQQPNQGGAPMPESPAEQCDPPSADGKRDASGQIIGCAPPPRNQPVVGTELPRTLPPPLVFVRSRALETILASPDLAACRTGIGASVVLHATVVDKQIVEVKRESGEVFDCPALRGRALHMPDGVAVAVVAPVR